MGGGRSIFRISLLKISISISSSSLKTIINMGNTSDSPISRSATPTSARRRLAIVKEKKPKSTTVDSRFNPQLNGGDSVGGKRGGGGGFVRDLNLTFEEDLALERWMKLHEIKQTLAAMTPLTKRTTVAKQERSRRWLNLVSVFVKNVLLVVLVLGLGHTIYEFGFKDGVNIAGTGTVDLFDFDRRIVEAELLLKSAMKTIQAKVDRVDKKIEYEIGGLRRELSDKMKENGLVFREGLGKIEGRTDGLESSLGELVAMGLVKKDEFDKFFHELKNDKTDGCEVRDMRLDYMRASLRELIDIEFEKHGADGLGRVDYAVATGGAIVVRHSEPFMVKFRRRFYNIWRGHGVSDEAVKMLTPSFGEPGQCLPLKGSSGFVQIRLRTTIIPEAVTLEHVSRSAAFDVTSAPKDCLVSGWLESRETEMGVEEEKMFRLAEFSYDLDNSSAQTFNVLDSPTPAVVNMIRFDFLSNHGNPSQTCIYRLRVHGHQPSDVSSLEMHS